MASLSDSSAFDSADKILNKGRQKMATGPGKPDLRWLYQRRRGLCANHAWHRAHRLYLHALRTGGRDLDAM